MLNVVPKAPVLELGVIAVHVQLSAGHEALLYEAEPESVPLLQLRLRSIAEHAWPQLRELR